MVPSCWSFRPLTPSSPPSFPSSHQPPPPLGEVPWLLQPLPRRAAGIRLAAQTWQGPHQSPLAEPHIPAPGPQGQMGLCRTAQQALSATSPSEGRAWEQEDRWMASQKHFVVLPLLRCQGYSSKRSRSLLTYKIIELTSLFF